MSGDDLDDLIGKGPGDPDLPSGGRWITGSKPGDLDMSFWWDDLTPRQAFIVKHNLPHDLADQIDYNPRFDEDLEDTRE